MAADYIADVFKKNGLKPAGDSGTYLQNFRMFTARLGPGNSFRVDASEYVPGSDYVPHYLSPREDVEGPLVFVGYGISAPQLKFDELAGVNLRGRIAVVLDTNPRVDRLLVIFQSRGSLRPGVNLHQGPQCRQGRRRRIGGDSESKDSQHPHFGFLRNVPGGLST